MQKKAILIGVVLIIAFFIVTDNAQSPDSSSLSPRVSRSVSSSVTLQAALAAPLDNFRSRVTKKPFGIFITRENSPVTPEVFYGYHTAADFEILAGEENEEIHVRAICDGKLLQSRTGVTGYGGVMVQSCTINNQAVTVMYGHVIRTNQSALFKAGTSIGRLGNAYSMETSNERKHLHLGIHKGGAVDIRGYVQNQSELSGWIDPLTVLPN